MRSVALFLAESGNNNIFALLAFLWHSHIQYAVELLILHENLPEFKILRFSGCLSMLCFAVERFASVYGTAFHFEQIWDSICRFAFAREFPDPCEVLELNFNR